MVSPECHLAVGAYERSGRSVTRHDVASDGVRRGEGQLTLATLIHLVLGVGFEVGVQGAAGDERFGTVLAREVTHSKVTLGVYLEVT